MQFSLQSSPCTAFWGRRFSMVLGLLLTWAQTRSLPSTWPNVVGLNRILWVVRGDQDTAVKGVDPVRQHKRFQGGPRINLHVIKVFRIAPQHSSQHHSTSHHTTPHKIHFASRLLHLCCVEADFPRAQFQLHRTQAMTADVGGACRRLLCP